MTERGSRLSVGEKFEQLRSQWKSATQMEGSMTKIVKDPNYQEIINMGNEVLPFIFSELENDPDHWFFALSAITGENPTKEEDAGNLPKMTESWIEWGRENGFVLDEKDN